MVISDVNECANKSACGRNELCFNQLGTFSCIRNPCPGYSLDVNKYLINYLWATRVCLTSRLSLRRQCIPRCTNCTDAPINLHTLAFARGLRNNTPLVRLTAKDNNGRVIPGNQFHIVGGSTDFHVTNSKKGRATGSWSIHSK